MTDNGFKDPGSKYIVANPLKYFSHNSQTDKYSRPIADYLERMQQPITTGIDFLARLKNFQLPNDYNVVAKQSDNLYNNLEIKAINNYSPVLYTQPAAEGFLNKPSFYEPNKNPNRYNIK